MAIKGPDTKGKDSVWYAQVKSFVSFAINEGGIHLGGYFLSKKDSIYVYLNDLVRL